jgi:hypothetical protein
MEFALALAVFACLAFPALAFLLVLSGIRWTGAAARRLVRNRDAAATFLRAHADDPRLPRRLRYVAEDERTPASSRLLLTGMARYFADPSVLAPFGVRVVGRYEERAVGSVLLWLAWRGLPPDLWLEGFAEPTNAPPRATPKDQARPAAGSRLGASLRRDAVAGREDVILRRLNRELPKWPVAATLIEVARELLELERNVATAREAGVPDAVTDRLAEEAQAAGEALWLRADRLAAVGAYRIETPSLLEALEREDQQLSQLRAAIREARTGLAELTLAGGWDPDALGRAERRFRALAAAARELQELDRAKRP